MTTIAPSCLTCRHFHRDDRTQETCNAFPDGIPAPIWRAEHKHKTPYPGDRGIQYEPVDGIEEENAE